MNFVKEHGVFFSGVSRRQRKILKEKFFLRTGIKVGSINLKENITH